VNMKALPEKVQRVAMGVVYIGLLEGGVDKLAVLGVKAVEILVLEGHGGVVGRCARRVCRSSSPTLSKTLQLQMGAVALSKARYLRRDDGTSWERASAVRGCVGVKWVVLP